MQARLQRAFFLFPFFYFLPRNTDADGWLGSEMTKGLEKINGRREGFGRGERGSGRYRMLKPPPRVIITFPKPWYRKPQLRSRKPRGSENLSGASSASTFSLSSRLTQRLDGAWGSCVYFLSAGEVNPFFQIASQNVSSGCKGCKTEAVVLAGMLGGWVCGLGFRRVWGGGGRGRGGEGMSGWLIC
ncbi:hypothetical protein BGX38DRAFT_448374 [Terfezia claveryi]|nr:hypothetical protein BGX38DRAFT_448374 [Terfezia claveryi]